ncbi:peroxiredoxin [Candidatus Parvarchaeota archaeon]|nr:peroxiredoxin [Candidatus Parvarchaeota archaeon]
MNIKENDAFPSFSLPADDGSVVSLSSLKGKVTVVYFYPKDDTPGCTTEACGFRDSLKNLDSLGVPVYGISVDSVESHKKFKEKYKINFRLLSDSQKKLVEKLGIKSMTGVASRVTFILDENGRVLKIYPKVSPDLHASEVIEYLSSLKKDH